MERPLISVILPVYNEEAHLRECLDTVLGQSLRQIEVICVDDGSRDGTPMILQEYVTTDERVRVITRKHAGAGAARNAGMKLARGEYLSFLDAECFYEPDMLGSAYLALEESQADFILLGSDVYQEDEGKFVRPVAPMNRQILPPYQPFSFRSCSGNPFLSMMGWSWDKVYRRSFLEQHGLFFQEQRAVTSPLLVYSALLLARRIIYDTTVRAHGRRPGRSGDQETSWYCFYDTLIALRGFLKEKGLYEELKRSYHSFALRFSLWNLTHFKGDACRKVYWHLQTEWFETLGLLGKSAEYFESRGDYQALREICERTFRDYPVKLSVIIPVHNAEKYLRACLDSVLANDTAYGELVRASGGVAPEQRLPLEVICVDDASTDKSLRILREYEKKYANVHVLVNRTNVYAGVSRNRGLEEAKGRYVHFLDADDLVIPGTYRTLYDMAVEGRLDFVKTSAEAVDSVSGEVVDHRRYALKLDPGYDGTLMDFHHSPRKFLTGISVVPWNAIYRREFLEQKKIRFNDLFCVNDRSFFVETCMKAERMTVARYPLVRHRVNVTTSLVSQRGRHFDCQFASYRRVKALCDENKVSERVRFRVLDAELFDVCYWYGRMEAREQEGWRPLMCGFFETEVDVAWFQAQEESLWLPRYEAAGGYRQTEGGEEK